MTQNIKDIDYMRAALSLARRGLGRTAPNPSVGCVLVKNGRVLATGFTADGGRPHAETIALAKTDAKGATAYVSLEPCSHQGQTGPCADALIKAGVKRVVVACTDPDPRVSGQGIAKLKAAGIEVTKGVLEKEAQLLNRGFFLKVQEQRPMVTLKVATSKDDKIAPASGKTQWLTGDLSRRHVHLERSLYDAILIGIGTVIKDNPTLTTRLEGSDHKIIRIILDSNLKIPMESRLLQKTDEFPLWIFYQTDSYDRVKPLEKAGARLFKIAPKSLRPVMRKLAEEGVTRLMVEGGGKVHASFVRSGLGDQLLWYRAPKPMGDGVLAFEGLSKDEIVKSLKLKPAGRHAIGEDLLEIYEKPA